LPEPGESAVFRTTIAGTPVVAAATRFTSRDSEPLEGVVVYLVNVAAHRQTAMFLWAWRTAGVLVIVAGVMIAVRIPVRKFVLEPMDGLFVAAYAASRDDYSELPLPSVDNEFVDLYEMFNRLMGHLTDTRIYEATLLDDDSTASR
jgi:nitrate/nitrite-specific signal transduction histidine kinase